MSTPIAGLWVATATPIDAAGAVDHPALARHAKRLLDQGCDGLVLFGTTGEGPSFSPAERLATAEALLRAGIGTNQLALSTGCPAYTETVALTRSALALGLDRALILPPYFFRDATEEGLADAFSAVLDGVADPRLRATLYHIPQTSGVRVPAAILPVLRARFGEIVAGVKDSTGDFAEFLAFRAAAPELAILVGNEVDIPRALAQGGAGTICGMANIVPGLVRRLFHDANAASAMRGAIALMAPPFLPSLKSVLAAETGEDGWRMPRPPLRAAEAAVGQRIAEALAKLSPEPAVARAG
jgi:4-hydroxy-tetrahydrodipicolinate synthase